MPNRLATLLLLALATTGCLPKFRRDLTFTRMPFATITEEQARGECDFEVEKLISSHYKAFGAYQQFDRRVELQVACMESHGYSLAGMGAVQTKW